MSTKKRSGMLGDYISMARLEYSARNIFILPGLILAHLLRGTVWGTQIQDIVLGFVMAFCIASANYTINEWMDRDFDRHHPTKRNRAAVRSDMKPALVFIEWLSFLGIGLVCGWLAGATMMTIGLLFVAQGIVYNVLPMRSKDRPYLDVISESVNNPIRLAIGWAMVDPFTLPPSSIILSYWFCGAFLMAAKRLSEHKEISSSCGKELLVKYRASFAGYSEESLTVSCFIYGLMSSFFVAVFLIKYRIEYILIMPFITGFFGRYLYLSLRSGHVAQRPERMFVERGLASLAILSAAVFAIFTFIDVPFLSVFADQRYIGIENWM